MAKIDKPKNEKPKKIEDEIKLIKYYLAIVLKSLKIEDTDNDIKWDNR